MEQTKVRTTRKMFLKNLKLKRLMRIDNLIITVLVCLALNIVLNMGLKVYRVYQDIQMNELLEHQAKNCLPMG